MKFSEVQKEGMHKGNTIASGNNANLNKLKGDNEGTAPCILKSFTPVAVPLPSVRVPPTRTT